jgi:hypothetical protein
MYQLIHYTSTGTKHTSVYDSSLLAYEAFQVVYNGMHWNDHAYLFFNSELVKFV